VISLSGNYDIAELSAPLPMALPVDDIEPLALLLLLDIEPMAFLVGALFVGAFLAGAFLAGAFMAGAFMAGPFFEADFFDDDFFDEDFFAAAFFEAPFFIMPPPVFLDMPDFFAAFFLVFLAICISTWA